MARKKTLEEFINDARNVHGGRYDYSKVDYVNDSTKIIITCRVHTDFKQTPSSHLSGHGCPKCGTELVISKNTPSTEEFIEKSKKVHGERYDYSKVEYVGYKNKVIIICNKHGEFLQTPSMHLQGQGCPKCGKIKERENASKTRLLRKFEGVTQPEEYKLIPLTQGKFATVDNEDFENLSQFNWNITEQGYAFNKMLGLMHRFIMNAPDHLEVDHKEHNRLDNRKSELRLATRTQNSANTRPRKGGSSKYIGVYWSKRASKWVSDITKGGKKKRVGTFTDEIECAKAYDRKALELYGDFAYLNFPELKQEYLKQLEL